MHPIYYLVHLPLYHLMHSVYYLCRKEPPDPNAPLAPLPLHLHPPPMKKVRLGHYGLSL